MKDRPIMMTPENAQKCHDGTKTQTRRMNNLEIVNVNPSQWQFAGWLSGEYLAPFHRNGVTINIKCPYGVAGDRLWVREAWQEKAWSSKELNQAGFLSAPKKPRETYLNQDLYAIHKGGYNRAIGDPGKWRSSIHMPRWACRTVLEITELRVERLQEISEEDAKAEGVTRIDHGREYYFSAMRDEPDHRNWGDPTDAYKELWESIHGKGSWELNPWVWVIEFRKVEEDVND